MSVLKPVAKRANVANAEQQTTLTRTTRSLDLQAAPASLAEEKDHPTSSTQTSESGRKIVVAHPKGHKVRNLSDVWSTVDSQNFLHLSDILTLMDFWVQPSSAEPAGGGFANVFFKQIIAAPHIKQRDATCKMSTDDLLKMLYLNETICWDMKKEDHLSFDAWLNEKSAACVKAKGLDEGSNRAKLCNFIITEDPTFTFYPMEGRFGVFFRKICYHSYKTDKKDGKPKLVNPSMIKCCATRGKFEYVLEARIFPLHREWYTSDLVTDEEVPATQPM